jgi:hypothetical protein
VLGGFGVGYAKLVAEKLKTMQDDCKAFTNPDEINYQVPMRWAAPDEKFGDGSVCHPVAYKEKSAVSVESKVSHLSNLIVEQELMGFLAKIDHGTAVDDPSSRSGHESWAPEHIRSCSWLSPFSKFAWRHGPNAYPLPGMGGYSTLASPHAAVLQLIPIEPLVESGLVVLADLAGFLETDLGLKLASKHAMFVPMKTGDVLWSPLGYLILPLYIPVGGQKEDIAFMWHLTSWSKVLCGRVSAKTWAAIEVINDSHHAKVGTTQVWEGRAAMFKKFCVEARVKTGVTT